MRSNDADHIFLFDFHQELKSLLKEKRIFSLKVCFKVKGLAGSGATIIYLELFTASEKFTNGREKWNCHKTQTNRAHG